MHSNEDLIMYRLERARESLDEAIILSETNHWNTVANRLYYASFYAVTALLVKFELSSASHSGTKTLFNREFIKTGKLDKKYGKLYNNLFNKRQEGDYEDFQSFDAETIRPLISLVKRFFNEVEKLL
jgi:uncharacterized protein